MSTFAAEEAHAAVQRGAAWLDTVCPDWPSMIDLGTLNMGDGKMCMLGQTANCIIPDGAPERTCAWCHEHTEQHDPHYTDVLEYVSRIGQVNGNRDLWSYEHGFDVRSGLASYYAAEARTRYEMLRIAWIVEINRRRLGATSPPDTETQQITRDEQASVEAGQWDEAARGQ